jgi:probable HAF family extracellular repeat protein
MFTSFHASASATTAVRAAALALSLTLSACGGGHHHGNPGGPGPGPIGNGPTYDVIPIGLPGIVYGEVTRHGIANGGIVAGTSRGADGVAHAFFYNGHTSISLGTLGGDFSDGQAVNPCGHVTGWSATAGGIPHAFLYDGALHDLGTLGGTSSEGYVISNCGKITGWASTASGQSHAFWYDGKTLRDLGSLGGDSFGLGVNTVGQIVGYSYGPGNAWFHAFLYDTRTGGPLQDLGSPNGNSVAVDINDAGQVAGWFRNGAGPVGAFVYEAGTMRDIGTLGGATAEAVAINRAGLVAGNSALADGSGRGFVYDGTTMTSIGALPAGNFSIADAINADGLVVGSATTKTEEHAIAWTRKDGIVDLNDRVIAAPAGLVLVRALAVADDGDIVVRTNTGLALLKPRK